MRRVLSGLMLALLASTPAVTVQPVPPAQRSPAPRSPLVQVAWLADQLSDPRLVLLHTGSRGSYDAGHIPGARYAMLMELHDNTGLATEMLPPDRLRERLAALGLSDDSRVVIYAARGGMVSAARLALTLEFAGLADVRILDGGLAAWTAAGKAVSTDVPPARPGSLRPLAIRPVTVDAEFVRSHLETPGYAVVDGRSRSFYDGVEVGGSPQQPHKSGHIAGALSIPFNAVQGADETMKSAAELRQVFADAGVRSGDVVIGYCHIGFQASAVLLAARMLGHKVLLYDGSFEDWSYRDLPVEAAAGRRR